MKALGAKNNFLGLDKKNSDYKNSQIVIQSIPLEKTVTYGKGTKYGPKEIINASHHVEYFDEELNREVCFDKGICTLEPLNFQKLTIEKSLQKIYQQTSKLLSENKFVASIGGEHSLSSAVIKAHHENYNDLTVLQLDAHSDLRNSYNKSKNNHASVMARVAEFNTNIVQVGIRAQSKEEAESGKQLGIKTFYSREIKMGMYGEIWQELIDKNLGDYVYITFDLDVFDPSLLPATGIPEPGGLMWDETMDLLKIIGMDRIIVGFDIVELAPSKSHPSSNYTAAKLLYKLINYAFTNK